MAGRSLTRLALLIAVLPGALGHAYVYWPASRNFKAASHIAHCFNVPGPDVNFQTAHNAGGKAGPSDFAKGMCGYFGEYQPSPTIGGDGIANWAGAVPVETYQAGGSITFTIVNNAEHGGHYEFRLCDRKLDASIGSREDAAQCFDAHFLGRRCVPKCGCDGDSCRSDPEHNDPNDPIYSHGTPRHLQQGGHQVEMTLPPGLTCEMCTIQWFWHTAWGEQFWNCIDIRIKGNGPPLPSTAPVTTLAPVTTTPSGGGGGDDVPCIWTTPAGRQVQTTKQNEKPGRICWEFTVPMGTTVHYQSKVDIYHAWNADTCCLSAGSSSAEGPANVVTFTPHYGSFGFCECIGWTPETGGTTCAGQATPDNMICPVGGGAGNMCIDTSPILVRPSECGGSGSTLPPTLSPPPTSPTTPAPPTTCAPDWGNCLSSRCCASSGFTCYEEDASYAECRNDACPAGWACTVLTPGLPMPQTCAELCGRTPSGGSCAAHTDAVMCTSHYSLQGAFLVPCSWTGCGECFADGSWVMDCPDLETLCASGCQQLCGKADLGAVGMTCGDLSHDQTQCMQSFHSKVGVSMLCKWSGCGCYADGETLLECSSHDSLCPPSLTSV